MQYIARLNVELNLTDLQENVITSHKYFCFKACIFSIRAVAIIELIKNQCFRVAVEDNVADSVLQSGCRPSAPVGPEVQDLSEKI